MKVIELDPKQCTRWQGADRAGFEFGDIYTLAKDIQKHGQIEPVIVRKSSRSDYSYEIIAGSRRWKACLEANLNLKAIVRHLNDEEALLTQIKENDKMPICDYSKGMSYYNSLKTNMTTHDKLAEILGISQRKLYHFLTFSKVPQTIWDAVGNLSRVSSKASEKIYALANKGDVYVKALIDIAEEIRLGIGANSIERKVTKIVNGKVLKFIDEKEIQLSSGQVIGYWTKGGIRFHPDISINQDLFEDLMKDYFKKATILEKP